MVCRTQQVQHLSPFFRLGASVFYLALPDQDELHNLRALLHRMGSSPGPSLVSHLLALWQTVEKEAKENGELVLGH